MKKTLIITGSLLFIGFVLMNVIYFKAPNSSQTSGYKSPDSEKMQRLIISLNE